MSATEPTSIAGCCRCSLFMEIGRWRLHDDRGARCVGGATRRANEAMVCNINKCCLMNCQDEGIWEVASRADVADRHFPSPPHLVSSSPPSSSPHNALSQEPPAADLLSTPYLMPSAKLIYYAELPGAAAPGADDAVHCGSSQSSRGFPLTIYMWWQLTVAPCAHRNRSWRHAGRHQRPRAGQRGSRAPPRPEDFSGADFFFPVAPQSALFDVAFSIKVMMAFESRASRFFLEHTFTYTPS